MSLETYWLLVPLVGLGLSAFGWLALWLTREPNLPFRGSPRSVVKARRRFVEKKKSADSA